MNKKIQHQMPKPRICKQATLWHGFPLKKGDIFGRDASGYYIAKPYMYKQEMIFKRQNAAGLWIDTIASGELLKPMYAAGITLAPYPKRKPKAEKGHDFFKAQMQAGVIRKSKHRNTRNVLDAQNSYEFTQATYKQYGATVYEIGGKFCPLNDKFTTYLEGGNN